eukprot:CAMPEP_0173064824 /NCGR_PEP_ID=MMETSP1102-20130122/5239_1 /TAXON_ID=49646 /ORGANISM="Geminigera sp., Strain Caron Lab Isolate" /LENGTH=231 /DNA_ID=CAMNT_0013931951 /DNA_START=322 /DNA_END=1017 /DNA_ORIENTATION=+
MLSISKVAPVLSAVQPSWRKAAALLVTTIAAVAVVTHAVTNHAAFRTDVLLQTGQKTVFERALESKLALAEAQATRTSQLSMGQEFWDTMHARTASVMSAQEDCGVPGGANDRRRGGCIIPIDGPTTDLKCCTSCCQGLMGECGPCDGLLPSVPHTATPTAPAEMQTAVKPESTDCGIPGSDNDLRRPGCIIPVDGSTADLACCTSCCKSSGGECGDCSGLGTTVPHTIMD